MVQHHKYVVKIRKMGRPVKNIETDSSENRREKLYVLTLPHEMFSC
jgi:hypothetical protein